MGSHHRTTGFMECSFLSSTSERDELEIDQLEARHSSYLSEDLSSPSAVSPGVNNTNNLSPDPHPYLSDSSGDGEDADSNFDSFVARDSEVEDGDSSFESALDSPMMIDSPIRPRAQPPRYSKHDLNTPLRSKRRSSKIQPVDSLEKVKGTVYKCHKQGSKLVFDPSDGAAPQLLTPKGASVLKNVHDEEQRRILLELYPEFLAEQEAAAHDETGYELKFEVVDESCGTPKSSRCSSGLSGAGSKQLSDKKARQLLTPKGAALLKDVQDEEQRRILLELYPEFIAEPEAVSHDDTGYELKFEVVDARSGTPKSSRCSSALSGSGLSVSESAGSSQSNSHCNSPSTSERSAAERNSMPNANGDDTFEKYLATLRGESAQSGSSSSCISPVADLKRFVVDDDEVTSSDFSEDDFEEEPETSEEEEQDKENIVVPKPSLLDSLKAEFASPSVHRKPKQRNDDDYFLDSLSPDFQGKRHPDSVRYLERGIKTKSVRDQLTLKLFELFKRRCFDDSFPMEASDVKWNARLRKTAGLCRNHGRTGTASIELSPKVCTTPDRLRDTLVHEMCHAATWIVDHIIKAGHGPHWKRWASQCVRRCPSLPHIERCHDYEIEAKYVYECDGCQQKVKRHSKSFDTSRFRCGKCRGLFHLKVMSKAGVRPPNKFAAFVKDNYGKHKTSGVTHKEVMTILSAKWKEVSTTVSSVSVASTSHDDLDMSVLSIHD